MRRRILFLSVIGVLAAAALAVAAAAGPPDHFTDTQDYSGSSPCGGFDDMYQGHLDVSGITKFDKQGNPVQDVVHISGWEKNWRSDDPSVSFVAKRQWTVTFDYATGIEKDSGMVFSANAPGVGVLFHDVGSVLFDSAAGVVIAVHGPHDVLAQGDAAFCNALLAIS
jgi:hypothetical protein